MNMEDLIEKKRQYDEMDSYGLVDITKAITFLPEFISTNEVISKANTKGAVKYLEEGVEKVVDYFGSYAYEYDLLEVSISLVPFIKEGVIRRGVVIEDPHKFIPHQIILKPEYFLDDYVSITFKISVYKEPHFGEYMKEDNDFLEKSQVFSPSSEFIVKYNEFINLINELGYELVQYPNFERVRDAMKCRPSSEIKSIIEIDFRLKNNRKAKVKR